MPIYKGSVNPKKPTFREWLRNVHTGGDFAHLVECVWEPNKFPEWTFVTEHYRFNIKTNPNDNGMIQEAVTDERALIIIGDVEGTVEICQSDEVSTDCEYYGLVGVWHENTFGFVFKYEIVQGSPSPSVTKPGTARRRK